MCENTSKTQTTGLLYMYIQGKYDFTIDLKTWNNTDKYFAL